MDFDPSFQRYDPKKLTIRQPFGLEAVFARAQIATVKASKLSLMPEGLEEGLTPQNTADLLDYIISDLH